MPPAPAPLPQARIAELEDGEEDEEEQLQQAVEERREALDAAHEELRKCRDAVDGAWVVVVERYAVITHCAAAACERRTSGCSRLVAFFSI